MCPWRCVDEEVSRPAFGTLPGVATPGRIRVNYILRLSLSLVLKVYLRPIRSVKWLFVWVGADLADHARRRSSGRNATIPAIGPGVRSRNAQRQPIDSAITGTSRMVTMVRRNPRQV